MPRRRPEFLNVDLEIESRANPEALVAALARDTIVLATFRRGGHHVVSFELANESPPSAAAAIRRFVRLIGRLPPGARRIWQRARRRDFDAGFELASGPGVVEIEVSPDVARQVDRVGGRIVFTLYERSGTRRAARTLRLSLAG